VSCPIAECLGERFPRLSLILKPRPICLAFAAIVAGRVAAIRLVAAAVGLLHYLAHGPSGQALIVPAAAEMSRELRCENILRCG